MKREQQNAADGAQSGGDKQWRRRNTSHVAHRVGAWRSIANAVPALDDRQPVAPIK